VVRGELPRRLLVHEPPDRLARLLQRRIRRIHQHLRDQGGDDPADAGALQRVLERLLDHVADPPRGGRDQHAQRQRGQLGARPLVAQQLVADLRAVAMHDHDPPAAARQLHHRGQALPRVGELLMDVAARARRLQRVAAQCHDDRRSALSGRGLRHDNPASLWVQADFRGSAADSRQPWKGGS
jgi:hypothetical protein